MCTCCLHASKPLMVSCVCSVWCPQCMVSCVCSVWCHVCAVYGVMCVQCMVSCVCSVWCHVSHCCVVVEGPQTYLSELHSVVIVTCDSLTTHLAQIATLTCNTSIAPPHHWTRPTGSAGHSQVHRPHPLGVHTHFPSNPSLVGELLVIKKCPPVVYRHTKGCVAYLEGAKIVAT